MNLVERRMTRAEIRVAKQRRREGQHLQALVGNPLDAEDIAMFEMFEREGWPLERCLAYIRDSIVKKLASQKAQ